MRVLGIDPALRRCGWAVIEGDTRRPRVLGWGEIAIPRSVRQSRALEQIRAEIVDLVDAHRPEAVAVEGIIYVQSVRTAISMGAARAAASMAGAAAGLPVFEYPPARVKQAVTGRGQAKKEQVAFMIRALLGLSETPPADAADALAIALTHLQAEAGTRTGLQDRREL